MTYSTFRQANDIVAKYCPSNVVSISAVSVSANHPVQVEITYPTGAKEVCNVCDVLANVSLYNYYIANPDVLYKKWTYISCDIPSIVARQLSDIIKNPRIRNW